VIIGPSEIIKVTDLGWGAFFEEYERIVLEPLKEQRKAAKAWHSALRKSPEEHQRKLEHQRKQMAVEARSSKILAAKAMEDAAKRRQALKKERAVRDAEAAGLLEQQQREHERKSALEKTRVYCASQERRAKRRAERRRVAILRAEDEARALDVAIRCAEEDASNSAAPLPSPENGSPALAADRETGPLLFALRSHLAKLADVRRRANKRVYSPRAARRARGRGRQSAPPRSAPTSASRKSPPGIPQQPAPPPLLISAVHLAPADAPATSSAASGDGASNGTIFVLRVLGGALVALGFEPPHGHNMAMASHRAAPPHNTAHPGSRPVARNDRRPATTPAVRNQLPGDRTLRRRAAPERRGSVARRETQERRGQGMGVRAAATAGVIAMRARRTARARVKSERCEGCRRRFRPSSTERRGLCGMSTTRRQG